MLITSLLLSMATIQEAPVDAENDEMECRRVKEEAGRTGSNLRRPARTRKVCRTAGEWAQIDQAKEEMFRALNENSGTGGQQGSSVGG